MSYVLSIKYLDYADISLVLKVTCINDFETMSLWVHICRLSGLSTLDFKYITRYFPSFGLHYLKLFIHNLGFCTKMEVIF